MGHGLADSLLADGYAVTVWNRTPEKAGPLIAAGARPAPTVAEAARGCEATVVCLTNCAAVETVVMTEETGAALRGRLLVDLTGMREEDAGRLADWAAARGVSFLKGVILAYPDGVRARACPILYGGAKSVFDAARPVLQAMGGMAMHIGEGPADGLRMGIAYLSFLYPVLAAFLHGAALCHRWSMPVETYVRSLVLPVMQGPVLRGMVERVADASLTRRYDQDLQATLDIWNAALARIVDRLEADGSDHGLLPAVKSLLDHTAASGFGQQDFAAMFETLIADRKP